MLTRVNRRAQAKWLSSITYTPPDLADLPKRWPKISPPVKEEIIEYLTWRMEDDWRHIPFKEIRASYFVSYGEWGPRSSAGDAQVSPTFLIHKGLFNALLFIALGVSVLNIKRDKSVDSALNRLKSLESRSETQ